MQNFGIGCIVGMLMTVIFAIGVESLWTIPTISVSERYLVDNKYASYNGSKELVINDEFKKYYNIK